MRKHVQLFITVCTVLLLAGCSSKPREVVIDDKFKMVIPGDLVSTKLNEDASLQYANIFKELYVMVIEDVPEEVFTTIRDLELEDEYPLNFDGFCMLVCSGDETVFAAKSDRERFTDTTINGMKARIFSNTRTINDTEVYYQMALIQGEETYYQIISWTLPKRSKKNKTIMEDMINSFEEINL